MTAVVDPMQKFIPRHAALFVCAAFLATAATAQTTSKTTHHKTSPHRKTATASQPLPPPVIPKTIPAVTGPIKYEFALRYQDVTVGSGDPAAPGKVYKVQYTGWLEDGTKFD